MKFILTHGILYWAIPFTIFMILFELNDKGFNFNSDLLFSFLTGLPISSIIGILSAIYSYRMRDKKYYELKEKSLIE